MSVVACLGATIGLAGLGHTHGRADGGRFGARRGWTQSVGARAPGPRSLGPSSLREPIQFSLVLPLSHRRALDRFLAQVNDPRSRQYGRFIGAATFGRRYGISSSALRMLLSRLRRAEVHVVARFPQRTAIEAWAPAEVVDRLFSVRLGDYLDQRGRRYHAPAGSAVIPPGLRGMVSAVAGLDSELPARSPVHLVPTGGLRPQDVNKVYDLAPLTRAGIEGQGQRLAIISYATHNPADPAAFSRQFGLGGPAPQRVRVQGGPSSGAPLERLEVDVDLEVAHAVAPRAQLLDYEAPLAGNVLIGPVLDAIVAQHRADVVSVSWGQCERSYRPGEIERDENAILAADAAGISLFAASGDQGAYDCQALNPADQHLSVDWPAGSPGVVAVGGTSLSVARDGGYAGEAAWEGVLSQRGGGGGLDAQFARPSWQTGAGVLDRFSTGARQVPDVSADADLATGWTVYHSGHLLEVGGTSASAPFWAAATVLIRQYTRRGGVGPLGFVDPMLYRIAEAPRDVPAFHDVTVGGNRYYPATSGWDFATGLGSPDIYSLARDVFAYLRARGH